MREAWKTNSTNLLVEAVLVEAVKEVIQSEVQRAAAQLGLEAQKNKYGGAQFAAKRAINILLEFQNGLSSPEKDHLELKHDL